MRRRHEPPWERMSELAKWGVPGDRMRRAPDLEASPAAAAAIERIGTCYIRGLMLLQGGIERASRPGDIMVVPVPRLLLAQMEGQ